MPLFESQKGRSRRLLEKALEVLLGRLLSVVEYEEDVRTHSAWLVGGHTAALTALETSPAVRQAWGKGCEESAMGLIEVFALAMISRWYRQLDEAMSPSESDRKLGRETAASNIMSFFGHDKAERTKLVQDFMAMDAQYNYDADRREDPHHEGTPLVAAALLVSSAVQGCGSPSKVDFGRLSLPMEDTLRLRMFGCMDGEFEDYLAFDMATHAGAMAMYAFFRARSGQA